MIGVNPEFCHCNALAVHQEDPTRDVTILGEFRGNFKRAKGIVADRVSFDAGLGEGISVQAQEACDSEELLQQAFLETIVRHDLGVCEYVEQGQTRHLLR